MANPLTLQDATPPTAAAGTGLTLAQPVPFGAASDGPLTVTVLSVLTGVDAQNALAAASPMNQPLLDTVTPVIVTVAITNTSPVPVHVGNDDFAITGASGIVRRYLDSRPPDPVLDITLQPGESTQGTVVFASGVDEVGRVLIADPTELGGMWAVRYLALEQGGIALAPPADLPQSNQIGTTAEAPAGIGDRVTTAEWSLVLTDVLTGTDVFDIVDYRTGALGPEDAVGETDGSVWTALRFEITCTAPGGALHTLPVNAFALTDTAGTPIVDMITITPPRPDAAGTYAPGGSRDGWVAFDIPVERQPVLVRFAPWAAYTESADARFFTI